MDIFLSSRSVPPTPQSSSAVASKGCRDKIANDSTCPQVKFCWLATTFSPFHMICGGFLSPMESRVWLWQRGHVACKLKFFSFSPFREKIIWLLVSHLYVIVYKLCWAWQREPSSVPLVRTICGLPLVSQSVDVTMHWWLRSESSFFSTLFSSK
jgi:hypothetical protein